eukprot:scaffold391582_cov56-Cyclotella_meneghiniana.AAC.2
MPKRGGQVAEGRTTHSTVCRDLCHRLSFINDIDIKRTQQSGRFIATELMLLLMSIANLWRILANKAESITPRSHLK